MKKQLFFFSLFIATIVGTLPAQTTGSNKPKSSAPPAKTAIGNKPKSNAYPAPQAAQEFKTKYRAFSSGFVIPLGAFGNRDYNAALSGAGGAMPGTLAEFSSLRLFNKEPGRPYYYGLQTLLTGYILPIKYKQSPGTILDDLRVFPAGEFKMGPAMAFPLDEDIMLDFNANIGMSVSVPLMLGYSIPEEYSNTKTVELVNVSNPLAFNLVGGMGINARFRKFVVGLDINFGKLKLDVERGAAMFEYDPFYGEFVHVSDMFLTPSKEELRITSFRIKIAKGW